MLHASNCLDLEQGGISILDLPGAGQGSAGQIDGIDPAGPRFYPVDRNIPGHPLRPVRTEKTHQLHDPAAAFPVEAG